MARGFMSGVLWGGVVGLGLSGAASLVLPLPSSPVVIDAAPDAASAPVDEAPTSSVENAAQNDTQVIAGQVTPQTEAPESDLASALDADALASAGQPQTGEVSGLDAPKLEQDVAAPDVDAATPVVPNPLALAPMAPQPADDIAISTEPAGAPAPGPSDVVGGFDAPAQPQVDDAGEETAIAPVATQSGASAQAPQSLQAPGAAEDTQNLTQSTVPAAPVSASETAQVLTEAPVAPADPPQAPDQPSETASADTAQTAALEEAEGDAPPKVQEAERAETQTEAPQVADTAQAQTETAENSGQTQSGAGGTAVVTRRIGSPSVTLIDRNTGVTINRLTRVQAEPEPQEEDATPVVSEITDKSDQPPVQQFSQDFENPGQKPLMSIVLIDDGSSIVAGSAGIEALRGFPYPLSFAVDASLSDAAERMAVYRAEGLEVMAMINLPEGAQPADAETALGVILPKMPEVVGVLEGTDGGLQGSRQVADQVTAILAQTGHGLLTQDKGLNTMPKLARKAGVPADPVFRDFDSKGQSAQVIRRFLDQAAFKAGQEGAVVMLGRLRADTISALLLWGLQDRAGKVALAPISALLLREE